MRSLLIPALLLLIGCSDPPKEETGDSQPVYEDIDGDGYTSDVDCDDDDDAINPGADEECDNLDNDCDGFVDDGDPDVVDVPSWVRDADGDGWGTDVEVAPVEACFAPSGYVSADLASDCDDEDPEINPDAEELCDGVDNDCSGEVDDADDAEIWYPDADGDGFGLDEGYGYYCEEPEDSTQTSGDCDDEDPEINPDATEVCDGVDNDCDGDTDGDDATDPSTWYADTDGDGWGISWQIATGCEAPSGYVAESGDCNDDDDTFHPEADEICDELDQDCDGIDDNEPVDGTTWYLDDDGDSYGDPDDTFMACSQPHDYVENDDDCDDSLGLVNPGADEICNEIDDDCDGVIDEDEAIDASTWYLDDDGDGYGLSDTTTVACEQPSGYAEEPGDCDDAEPEVNPGHVEYCDGIDNNCDGTLDNSSGVTFTDLSGVSTDLTSAFRAGSFSSPYDYELADDGTLTFCDGQFYTHITISATQAELLGLYGSASTVLSAASSDRVVTAGSSTTTVSLEGLDLTLGYVEGSGGGFYGEASGLALTVTDCIFSANDATDGGGIYAAGGTVDISGTSFLLNEASDDGGALIATSSSVSVSDSSFTTNTASSGGALYLDTVSLDLSETLLQGNESSQRVYDITKDQGGGGAVALIASRMVCTASSTSTAGVLANEAVARGGGVFLGSGSSLESAACDWGADSSSDDNDPEDVYVAGTTGSYDYGDDASFTCSDAGCI